MTDNITDAISNSVEFDGIKTATIIAKLRGSAAWLLEGKTGGPHIGAQDMLDIADLLAAALAAPQPAPQHKIGYERYEKLRKLNANQFSELHRRNIAGERFDDMVDELPGSTQ